MCWAAIASHMTWEDRSSLALVQRACAEGVAMLERGVRLDVTRSSSSTSRALPHTLRCRNIHTVLLVSGSGAYASSAASDEHEMWRSLDSSWKPGRVQWLLRMLTRRLGLASGGHRGRMPLRRTLRLSLPSMACTTTELETALLSAGADTCFSGVEVSKG